MATSFLRMGRSCCGLKSFQVNVCASWNRLSVVSYSSRLGDTQNKEPRRTHVKKVKPKPKLDVAQLLLSLGMKPTARPSTATKSAVTDAPRHTEPTASAPLTVRTSPPVPASKFAPAPASAASAPPPARPTSSVDSAIPPFSAAAVSHLPTRGPSSPSAAFGEPAESASTSPPPCSASLQAEPNTIPPLERSASAPAEPNTSPALGDVMETLSASAAAPSKPSEHTESKSAASCEIPSQETTGTPDVAVLEVSSPSAHQAAPSLVGDVDYSSTSETFPFPAVDCDSLPGPSPVYTAPSVSPLIDPISQTVSSTSAQETGTALREDTTGAGPKNIISVVTPGVTELPTPPETMSGVTVEVTEALTAPGIMSSVTPQVTETLTTPESISGVTVEVTQTLTTPENMSGVTPQVSSDAEAISYENTSVFSAPGDLVSATEPPKQPYFSLDPSVGEAASDSDSLELSTLRDSATGEFVPPQSPVSAPETGACKADAIKTNPEVEQPITADDVTILEDIACTSKLISAPTATTTEAVSLDEAAVVLEDVIIPDLTHDVDALSLLEMESFLGTVSHPKVTADDDSVAQSTPSADATSLQVGSGLEIAPFLENSSVPDLTPHLEAVSLLEVASFLETVPVPDITECSKESAEPAISLEDVTVPDFTSSLEAVSLLEVGEVLQDISAPEEVGSVPGVSSLQADISHSSPAADTDAVSLLEVAPSLRDALVPDLTPQLEAVSLLEVAHFLESMPDTEATTVTCENVSSEGTTNKNTSPPPKGIFLPNAELQLECTAVPAAEAMSPELLGAAESPQLDPMLADISTTTPADSASISAPSHTVTLTTPSDTLTGDISSMAFIEPVISMPPPDTMTLATPDRLTQDMSTATTEPITSTTPTDTVTSATPLDTLPGDMLDTSPSDELTENVSSTATTDTITLITPTNTITSTTPLDTLLGDMLATSATSPSDELTENVSTDPSTLITPTETVTSATTLDMLIGDTLTTPVSYIPSSTTPSHPLTGDISSTTTIESVTAITPTDTVTSATPLDTLLKYITLVTSTAPTDKITSATLDTAPSTTPSGALHGGNTTAHVPQLTADGFTDESAAGQEILPGSAESLSPPTPLIDPPLDTQDVSTDALTGATTEELHQESSEARLDPVQRLFLEKIREYATHSPAEGGGLEAGSEFHRRLAEEEAKLQRLYGGHDLTEFPEFKFPGG
ncbi:hypothetical protein ACEWY4_016204 [Coilia grayii]|uniref:ATP synthase peripheral stalk subunit F6, mitochondrial n=1 Tax=Coilia grayii TaxID=363190 RepID=A0ABD1JKX1_9TELE